MSKKRQSDLFGLGFFSTPAIEKSVESQEVEMDTSEPSSLLRQD